MVFVSEEKERLKKEQEEKEERKRNTFKIPKKKMDSPKPQSPKTSDSPKSSLPTDTENFINSLFDDSGLHSDSGSSDEANNNKKGENSKSSQSKSSSKSTSSDHHKSSSSDRHKSSSSSDRHKSSSDRHKSSSSSDRPKSSSSSDRPKSSSSSDRPKSSSSSDRHKSSSSSDRHKSSSSSDRHKSSSSSNRHKSSSDGHKSSDHKSSSDHHKSSSSSKSKSTSSHSSSDSSKSKHSSKDDKKQSDSSSKTKSVNGEGSTTKVNQPVATVLAKHHLNPIVERQASTSEAAPSENPEKARILARLAAIKQRTLDAIHKEHSGKAKRNRNKDPNDRKSKTTVEKNDEKSREFIRDTISSSEDEDDNKNTSALDNLLKEHEAKVEREKIARMARQAWERATKKDSDDDKDIKKKRKRKHFSRDRSDHKKQKSLIKKRIREHSLSPSPDRSTKSAKPKKPTIVRHSQNAPPPMDFKAILAMAAQKQTEPLKPAPSIPKIKKKKEEDPNKRPLTQEEKDRIERKKSKEYQDWLKNGGQRPGETDSDFEDRKKSESQKSHKPNSKVKEMSQRHLNGKTAQGGESPPIKREKDIKQEKDVYREKPVKDIKQEPSSNPFDRIMNQVHKKPASRPQPGECLFVSALTSEIYFNWNPLTDTNFSFVIFRSLAINRRL